MPPLAQVAAPASQSAQMLTGNSSSTPVSSTGESKDRGFSRHLDAQQRDHQHQAKHTKRESASAEKPAPTASEAKRSKADDGRDQVGSQVESTATNNGHAAGSHTGKDSSKTGSQAPEKQDALKNNGLQNTPEKSPPKPITEMPFVMAAGGNESPSEDALLPQQTVGSVAESFSEESVETVAVLFESQGSDLKLGGTGLELPAVEGEALAATAQQIAAQVSPSHVAGASPQGEGVKSMTPELLSAARDRQALALGEVLDSEVDAEPALALNLGKTVKASLLEGSTPKLPATTQVATDALSNGPKENFEQVRQHIMTAMSVKSEVPSPVNLAVSGGGGEASETTTQGLNFSNVSSTLAATGAESAKYSPTQTSTPPRFFTLPTPVGQPGWDAEVGNRIRWMVGQNNTGVELRLNPPELGSIEVKVATEGERSSITFFAANPAARDALELALPRLREMFADSGMQLANADVSDQGLQQDREQLSGSESFGAGNDRDDAMMLEVGPGLFPGEQAESRGVIDYYI